MLKMSRRQLCEKLIKQRDTGVSLFSYMGPRYFISKGLLLTMTIILYVLDDHPIYRGLALIGTGYLVGMIAAHLQRFVQMRNTWPVQKDLFDWEKVEAGANEERLSK